MKERLCQCCDALMPDSGRGLLICDRCTLRFPYPVQFSIERTYVQRVDGGQREVKIAMPWRAMDQAPRLGQVAPSMGRQVGKSQLVSRHVSLQATWQITFEESW